MSEFEEFRKYLEKKRKRKSKDNLTPITIETYIYLTTSLFNHPAVDFYNPEKLIKLMNKLLEIRPNIVMYAAYKNILSFFGYQQFRDNLNKPDTARTALKSIKALQSVVLTIEELQQLVDNFTENWERMIVMCIYDGALRKEEFLGMRVMDIHFQNIQKNPKSKIGALVNITGKGAKRREIYFAHTTCDYVKEWINTQKLKPEDFLFRFKDETGKPYIQQNFLLWKFLVKRSERILNRHVKLHALRHTKATHLCAAGGELLNVSRYLGHSSTVITLIYIEISPFLGKKVWEEHSFDISKH